MKKNKKSQDDSNTRQIHIRIPEESYQLLNALAYRDSVPKNHAIIRALVIVAKQEKIFKEEILKEIEATTNWYTLFYKRKENRRQMTYFTESIKVLSMIIYKQKKFQGMINQQSLKRLLKSEYDFLMAAMNDDTKEVFKDKLREMKEAVDNYRFQDRFVEKYCLNYQPPRQYNRNHEGDADG